MSTRTTLRRDLSDIRERVYSLGEKCMEVSDLYNSLMENYSKPLEERLIDITNEIKSESKMLNNQCFLVLTLQQPLIKDLRFVIGSLQIVLNLEKTSEQYLSTLPIISSLNTIDISLKEQIIDMANKVKDLLRITLTYYLSLNNDALSNTKNKSSEIIYAHNFLYKLILKEVAEITGEKASAEAQMLATIRALEKISDLTITTAEQINYIIVGTQEEPMT
jgi:phosphate transport system protein